MYNSENDVSVIKHEGMFTSSGLTIYNLYPYLKQVEGIIPDIMTCDFEKYSKLQKEIIEKLDQLLPGFDVKKDKKINLNLDPNELIKVIINPKILKDFASNHVYPFNPYKTFYNSPNRFIDNKYLRMLDLSSISLNKLPICGMDLSYTNFEFDPQKVWDKNVAQVNFEGVDMQGKCFDETNVMGTNFKDCKNLDLDPQKVFLKSFFNINLENVDMHGKCFDGVEIMYANLNYTNSDIDPQKLYKKYLRSNIDNINDLNLVTNNFIYKKYPYNDDMCYISLYYKKLNDNYEELYHYGNLPEYYTSLEGTSLRGISFKGKSFKNVDLVNCTIDDKDAKIDPQETIHIIYGRVVRPWDNAIIERLNMPRDLFKKVDLVKQTIDGEDDRYGAIRGNFSTNGDLAVKSLKGATLENMDLSNKSFKDVIVANSKLKNNGNIDYSKTMGDIVLVNIPKCFSNAPSRLLENTSIVYDCVCLLTFDNQIINDKEEHKQYTKAK